MNAVTIDVAPRDKGDGKTGWAGALYGKHPAQVLIVV